MPGDVALFYVFAGMAVLASVLVIGQRNPIYSVLLLIVSFGALAGLYVLLDAPFVAVTQIIVYAGAIMVLFLFVVMLLNVPMEGPIDEQHLPESPSGRRFGAMLAVLLLIELAWALAHSTLSVSTSEPRGPEVAWSVGDIGQVLYHEYAFAFVVTSVLIIVAMVGAVVLARREPR